MRIHITRLSFELPEYYLGIIFLECNIHAFKDLQTLSQAQSELPNSPVHSSIARSPNLQQEAAQPHDLLEEPVRKIESSGVAFPILSERRGRFLAASRDLKMC
jgi:hypothetical protein